jgi:molybdenum cofactor guanylyltransferase
MPYPEQTAITGAILAGGLGRRMGGIDKGWIELDGKPLIQHVVKALQPQVDQLVINANQNIDQYAKLGYPVIPDDMEGHQGPLAGFATLLNSCTTDWLVTVPCDVPRLPEELVTRLWDARQRTGADIAVAHDGQRLQPVHVLLARHLLPDLRQWLARGEHKIDRWYANHHMVTADFSDCADRFTNLNTPDDHHKLMGARS